MSHSIVWALQRRFYDSQGVNAWKDSHVPFEISSNAYLARRYAEILLGFLRDRLAGRLGKAGRDEPLLIVELGSGSGRLAYLVASELLLLTRALGMSSPAFRLVMTDFTENNLKTYASNPRLTELVDAGVLDFARFDAEKPHAFRLRHNGRSISPNGRAQPIALIANYLFDTVRHDAFKIARGLLYETRVGLAAKKRRAMPRRNDPNALDALEIVEHQVRVTLPYYRHKDFDAVLAAYTQGFEGCEMLFPIDALRVMNWFKRVARAPTLVLCGDKGYRTDDELKAGVGAYLSFHAKSSFSTMVNLNAIERVVAKQGGFALHAPQADTSFTVSAFVSGAKPDAAIETRFAFDAAMSGLGPRHFQTTFDELKHRWRNPSVPAVLSLLRLANHDQDVFLRFAPVLTRKVGRVSNEVRADVLQAMEVVWSRYYPLSSDEPVAFTIGLVFHAMRRFDDALHYFERALPLEGDDAITRFNIGLCYAARGEGDAAIEAYSAALARDPRYRPAAIARDKLRQVMTKSARP
ncbi:MAG: hypothetical protein EXQ99_00905 [Alphaproteobacteria bacterium]|nr:hypothetical protein [Alphaproteobacteria bacterium]